MRVFLLDLIIVIIYGIALLAMFLTVYSTEFWRLITVAIVCLFVNHFLEGLKNSPTQLLTKERSK